VLIIIFCIGHEHNVPRRLYCYAYNTTVKYQCIQCNYFKYISITLNTYLAHIVLIHKWSDIKLLFTYQLPLWLYLSIFWLHILQNYLNIKLVANSIRSILQKWIKFLINKWSVNQLIHYTILMNKNNGKMYHSAQTICV